MCHTAETILWHVPGFPANTVLRYWVTARSGGDTARSPHESAPLPRHAYLVEPGALDTALPVYHLFVDPRTVRNHGGRRLVRTMNTAGDNVDLAEVAKFDALASRWWDPEGDFRPLHEINPLRLDWIRLTVKT